MRRTESLFLVSVFAFCVTFAVQANASSTSGIDTPQGVTTLPLSVQGTPGCTLTGGANAAIAPNLNCNGAIQAGPQTDASGNVTGYATAIGADGSTTIGSNATPQPASVLTVNGDVTILGTATAGADCSSLKLGTVAQDGTGKLLSCQSGESANGSTFQTWQQAQSQGNRPLSCWADGGAWACYALSSTGVLYAATSWGTGQFSSWAPVGPGAVPGGASSLSCWSDGGAWACYALSSTGVLYATTQFGTGQFSPWKVANAGAVP